MLQASTSRAPSHHRSTSIHQTAAPFVYSKTESVTTEAAQQPAQAAAARAFTRAQERSSGVSQGTISASNSQGAQAPSQPVLKRRQSVRFVNRNSENRRTGSGTSTRIAVEPRPGFATHRPLTMTANTPIVYRPVSPLSYFGKSSAPSEAPEPSVSGRLEHSERCASEDDVASSQSVHFGVRKTKSMFMPLKAPDVFYNNGTPEKPAAPSFTYGSGISNVPISRIQSRQHHLKTYRSMNFLGLMRNHSASAGRGSNDFNVQLARDRFLHQTNQQRLRDKPSFLFRAKARTQEKSSQRSGAISSSSSDDMPFPSLTGGLSSWKESRLKHKARRAAHNIKNGFRRVFGRSSRASVEIPDQQVDAPETHVREYSGAHIQESSSDTEAQTSASNSDIQVSLASYKNMTVRLVPPTPKRLPVYDFSQDLEAPQTVAYSESVYSRTTGSRTPEPARSSSALSMCDDNQPNTGSAVILDTVTYSPTTPIGKDCRVSSSDSPAAWMTWMSSDVAKLENNKGGLGYNVANINKLSEMVGHVRHVRESAQINDDDTAVAQSRVIQAKQPLGELQRNGQLNPELMPVLRPAVQSASMISLVENIGFNRPKAPPPPPPLHPPAPKLSSNTPRLLSHPGITQPPISAEKSTLSSSLTEMVMSSRNQYTPSPTPSEPPKVVATPSPIRLRPHSLYDVNTENFAKTPSHGHERLWKLEPTPEPRSTHETLRNMLLEKENRKRPASETGALNALQLAAGNQAEKINTTSPADSIKIGGEKAEDKDDDIYGVEGAGLMGPSIAGRNNQLVGSLLSSRRSRIIGGSESDSDDAFI
jgi:hypothetical protein